MSSCRRVCRAHLRSVPPVSLYTGIRPSAEQIAEAAAYARS
ncbi:hypothetical protein [Pseudomonas sp. 2023EL-01195]|nr:hypothetical protein [Pseudomonas sp. 2023EL-01195]MDW3711559.1 hypothetical protein [Pseudomonas sp. 2023EL-01195]